MTSAFKSNLRGRANSAGTQDQVVVLWAVIQKVSQGDTLLPHGVGIASDAPETTVSVLFRVSKLCR